MADITMPQLGETVTEGTIIRWLKNVGDPIAHDEPLFEVSTDKVDSEVPSSAEGFVAEILVEEGATVDVGTRLAVVSDSKSTDGGAAAGEGAPADAGAEMQVPAAEVPAAEGAPAETEVQAPAAEAPAAEAPSAATEVAPPEAPGTDDPAGTGRPTPDTAAAPENAQPLDSDPDAARPGGPGGTGRPDGPDGPDGPGGSNGTGGPAALLSPVVRKLLNDNGVDAKAVRGTGQGGRITRGDVLAFLDARSAGGETGGGAGGEAGGGGGAPASGKAAASAPAPAAGTGGAAPAAPAAAPGSAAFPPAQPGERDEIVPFSNIRRLTAEHMVRSKATSAHTLVGIEADYEAVDRVRRRHKDRFKAEEGISLTYLPFIARAVVEVLRDYPNLNASVGDNALLVHRDVHLGIAVDLDRQGLIVPVVRQADGQSLRGLARAISDLAERARSRRLSADDVVGGTFTITNPGPFGTFITAPVINQPQVAILSTDGVKRRPVVVTGPDGSEAIAIHSVGMLALSFDHRAVDGAYASAFLRDLARAIEGRDWESEL